MDLYIQVGVLLVMASMFALVIYLYSDSLETGKDIHGKLSEPATNYSMDSSVTTSTFTVDSRVFTQWAINAKGQRQVYLVYPSAITPSNTEYGAYLHRLTVNVNAQNPADRSLVIHPQVPNNVNNAYYVNDQSAKTVNYLTTYTKQAKDTGTNEMITVYTFTDPESGEVIYVCYIK